MKYQALFSLKDKSKINKSVVCCNFAWIFNITGDEPLAYHHITPTDIWGQYFFPLTINYTICLDYCS